jgi:hypothetical protein
MNLDLTDEEAAALLKELDGAVVAHAHLDRVAEIVRRYL